MPIISSYGRAGSSSSQPRGIKLPVKPNAQVTSYYKGGSFVYTRVDDEHFVFNAHWFEYITLRKEQPQRAIIFDTLRELKRKLLCERGVLA